MFSINPMFDIYVKAYRIVTFELVRRRVTTRCDQVVTSKMDVLGIFERNVTYGQLKSPIEQFSNIIIKIQKAV